MRVPYPTVEYKLQALSPRTNYSIYIRAVSSHWESDRSNIVTVETEGV